MKKLQTYFAPVTVRMSPHIDPEEGLLNPILSLFIPNTYHIYLEEKYNSYYILNPQFI